MPNLLTLTVEEPDRILNAGAYGALAFIRLQWSATSDGVFADVSGTGSTPTTTVVANTRTYPAYDPNGTSVTWYRTRYENVGGTRLSDWSDVFQVGAEESQGYLCSLADVKQRLGLSVAATNDDETLLELIRAVSSAIEGYTGRWFAPRPSSGTTTKLLNTRYGHILWIPKGIRSITTLGYATIDQPSSGGSYTTIPSTAYVLEPGELDRDYGWPATKVRLLVTSGVCFFDAVNGAQITDGAFGFASVPADISDIAANAVIRKWIGKETAAPQAFIGPSGQVSLMRDISPQDMARLESYRLVPVA